MLTLIYLVLLKICHHYKVVVKPAYHLIKPINVNNLTIEIFKLFSVGVKTIVKFEYLLSMLHHNTEFVVHTTLTSYDIYGFERGTR